MNEFTIKFQIRNEKQLRDIIEKINENHGKEIALDLSVLGVINRNYMLAEAEVEYPLNIVKLTFYTVR